MKIYIDWQLLSYSIKGISNIIDGVKKLSGKDYIIFSEVKKIPFAVLNIYKAEGILLEEISENIIIDKIFYENGEIYINENKVDSFINAIDSIVKTKRFAEVKRKTNETDITVKINLDGEGVTTINTGIGFFDHMLEQIARHSNISLEIKTIGDLNVDEHHTIEDTGIALGEAIKKALGNKIGIKRYGYYLPMDESISKCALDLGGRSYLNFKCKFRRHRVGEFPTELTKEFFRALAFGMNATLYLRAKGKNDHHKIECMFKAFAKSLNEAFRFDERAQNRLPSTKGVL